MVFSYLRASVSAVSPSARSLVVGFSVVRATSRNLLPAVAAQGAALLIGGTVSAGTDNRGVVAVSARC